MAARTRFLSIPRERRHLFALIALLLGLGEFADAFFSFWEGAAVFSALFLAGLLWIRRRKIGGPILVGALCVFELQSFPTWDRHAASDWISRIAFVVGSVAGYSSRLRFSGSLGGGRACPRARRLRPRAGLPHRRADSDHRERRLARDPLSAGTFPLRPIVHSAMHMHRGLAVAFTLPSLLVAGAAASPLTLPAPRVRPASGWVVVKPSKGKQPYLYASMVVAVTAPDVAAVRPFAPFTSFTRLSPRGIIVWATTIGRNRPTFTRMRWPPLLSSFRVDHGWEGQPAPNLQQRLKWGAVGGWDMDVRVYFATQHPDRKLLRAAQAELDRLTLPSR